MIKVSGIINKRVKQSDPILAWLIFQNIYLIYHNIKNKEQSDYLMLLTSTSENIEANKQNDKVEGSQVKMDKNQNFRQNMSTPSDLSNVQPRSTQVLTLMKLVFIPM